LMFTPNLEVQPIEDEIIPVFTSACLNKLLNFSLNLCQDWMNRAMPVN